MLNLSERLRAVANLVISGEPVADIGSDHAYLPIFLVKNGIVPWAVAGELGDGPYEHALQSVNQFDLQARIKPRQGDGLQVLKLAEVSTVIIAGMGGESIAAILSCNWPKSNSFKRFIFQPMSRAEVLRKTLADRGWPIIDEILIIENEHYYLIIISEPGFKPYKLNELETEIGPQILQANDSIKRGFIASYAEKYGRVYHSLNNSSQPENRILAQAYLEKKKQLEVLLNANHG